MKLYIWLLVWLVCTLLLPLCERIQSFQIRPSECFYIFISYSYRIFIAYISVGKRGRVITFGFDRFFKKFLIRFRGIFGEMIPCLEDTPLKKEYTPTVQSTIYSLLIYEYIL